MSFIDSLLSSIRKSDSMEGSPCYTLFVHCDETEEIAEDDLTEPVAFQISMEMKWRDLQDLIRTEVGDAATSGFTYYDDESDEIRIDSQEEYETALHICRKDKRDLHIYSLRPPHRQKQRRKQRKSIEKKRPDDEFTVLATVDKPQPLEITESLHAPSAEEMHRNNTEQAEPVEAEETKVQLEGAIAAPSAPTEDTYAAHPDDQPELEQETTPMPAGNSLISIIKKEVREVLADEVDDVWRFVNALKRDINQELDVIGDQLAAHSAQLPTVQKCIRDQMNHKEASLRVPETSESEVPSKPEEDEEAIFAATFICESLLDGSRVQAGESFEKHWVFRNDGNVKWDENTELHLLYQTCNPPVATGTSLSEWGAKHKSVIVPQLKQGESGVVCAEHKAPAHGCNCISSWKLTHKDNPFGPRVWCNVRVENEVGAATEDEKNMESFEDLHAEIGTSPRRSLERTEESLHGSLVPASKLQVELKSLKLDDGLHNDTSILSFNMTDVSDGAKYIESHPHESHRHEAELYNPAVTSVEDPHWDIDEALHVSLTKKENVGASVDAEDRSSLSESPVMVTPPETEEIMREPELNDFEEPRTLVENDGESEEEDLYSSKYEKEDAPPAEDQEENFTEANVRTPDQDNSSDEEQQENDEEEPEPQEVRGHGRQISEDLNSVDYNLDDDTASMMSYTSGFVVVPLPECFDMNKPLTESQYEEKKEAESMAIAEPETATEEQPLQKEENEEDVPPRYPPEDLSDSEVESQPPSVNRANDYHSEDSIVSTTTPKSLPSPPQSVTPKVSLAPTFVPPQNETPVGNKEPQAPETPDSMDDSLTEKITKEFDAFLLNPEHPIDLPPKPKIPLSQMPTMGRQVPSFKPEPKPVPQSVLTMDDPYPFDPAETIPHYNPFEEGWRHNPMPVPSSVTNNDPWLPYDKPTPAPRLPSQLPRSQFTLEQNTQPTESTLPLHPFAVASPSNSSLSLDPIPAPRRPASPEIPIADDSYPPELDVAGLNFYEADLDEPDIFRTPPPSPPPRYEVELSPLDKLYEMGFHDLELNHNIFENCEQDLNRTVQALILRAEADEDMVA